MNISTTVKAWDIYNGVLAFKKDTELIIPTAEEIFSSVFEKQYNNIINQNDSKYLLTKWSFSKFPVELKLILETTSTKGFSIEYKIRAYLENGKYAVVSLENNADHIVIDNTWYPYPPGIFEEIYEVLKSVGIFEQRKITLGQYLQLLKRNDELIVNEVSYIFSNLSDKLATENPSGLKATLYPYQKKGWQWLRFIKQEKIGGILADEMGLGKTIQIIALLSSESEKDAFPSLIVSPSTLLENWRREFSKFSPQISTRIHQGPQRTGFPNELKNYNIIITSYDTIIRDFSLFSQIEWRAVICDEAQAIKNPLTKRAISIKKIPRQIGFAVTGTPIENSLTDLWSIMDFCVPGFLGKQADFERTYASTPESVSQLEKIISPLILRRRVIEVAKDLPAKIIIPQVLELNNEEIGYYNELRDATLNEFKSNASLIVLTRLRMFCAHPFLIEDQPNENPASYSTKYARMIEIAEEIFENNAKMLVFTSYNKMNDIITSDLRKRFGIYSESIDGRTPVSERQNIVDKYSSIKGSAALILNPIAAGTGLNITAANHVIHYNLEWNPAKEDQASARAYRRGQDRPVTIHRLFYADTVEEAIDERLNRKRELAGTAIVGVQGEVDDYDDILNALNKSPKNK